VTTADSRHQFVLDGMKDNVRALSSAPERAIFGKIRYITLESTTRKFRPDGYLEKHSCRPGLRPWPAVPKLA
jgi:hypothetical protein